MITYFTKNLTKFYLLAIALLLTPAGLAFAHVKWFVDSNEVISEKHKLTPFYYLSSKEVIIWSIISVIIVVIFSLLDRVIPEPKFLRKFAEKNRELINHLTQFLLGLFLVTVSVIWKIILIPEWQVNGSAMTSVLQYIQVLIGLMFIFNVFPRLASTILLAMCIAMGIFIEPVAILENALLISLAMFVFIRHSPNGSLFSRLDKHSVEIVRIGTAITLITLAFTEKLMYPELGLSFLDVHQWNFMQNVLGISWWSNKLFVLSTGFAELIFGVIFMLGYLTRINTVAIATFFAMSVVTMFLQFGMWEVEDLVVYAAAILFIFYGHGETKFFHFVPDNHILRRKNLKNIFRKN